MYELAIDVISFVQKFEQSKNKIYPKINKNRSIHIKNSYA